MSLALGDVARARELLADASRLARRTADVVVFQRRLDDVRVRFDERAESALAGMARMPMDASSRSEAVAHPTHTGLIGV